MTTKIQKQFTIDEPIAKVWTNLADPEKVVTCVPGASITEKIDDKNYKGRVVTKMGPIKVKYNGDIEIIELDQPNWNMVLKGRGLDSKGKGSADMLMKGSLREEGGQTHVDFSLDLTIAGMLAQFGARLINEVSDQLIGQFIDNFRNQLAGEAIEETEVLNTADVVRNLVTSSVKKDSPAESNPAATASTTNTGGSPSNQQPGLFASLWQMIMGLFGGKKS